MHPTGSRRGHRARRAVVVFAGFAVLGGCGSGGGAKASSTTTGATSTSSTAGSGTGSEQTTVTTTAPTSDAGTSSSRSSGRAFSDPCGLLSPGDVQIVLPGAPAGKATTSSATLASCSYAIDSEHRLNISFATGSATTMAATKKGVASLPGKTVVDGLGDVGYSSSQGARLDVHFFTGDTEVLISAIGQPGGADTLISLAKKVDAAM